MHSSTQLMGAFGSEAGGIRQLLQGHTPSTGCSSGRAVVAPSRRACGSKRSLLQYSPRLKGYLHLTHVPSVGI
ncbi:hypothetical protein V494_00731 [Pseudogymnoascus sp. VKM F-4513 (FW-928)]|nr:hypothetical protein V494_00731 [Pseudogymnoascus sp. VKM F-4513 (FW-928)]